MGSEMGEMLPAAAAQLDRIDDNILSEILLRLPPQPSSLPRASAVSKRWHSIACNPGFCRQFRRHHRHNAPLLGFFDPDEFLNFVSTPDAPNRVLHSRFSLLYDERDRYEACGGTVLRDAGDVHFRVVLVVGDTEDIQHRRALARVYSVETNLWGDLISMPLPAEANMMRFPMVVLSNPAVLVEDSLYWHLGGSISGILEFNLEGQSLDVIRLPVDIGPDHYSVIRDEGGGLGFLSVSEFTAQFWKRKTDSDGVASWVLGRTIELDKLLSLNPAEHKHILIRGFAEENNMAFLSTDIGLFMVKLQSLQFTFLKHTETTDIDSYHPFESVFTAETRNKGPEEFDLSEQYIGWPE